MELDPVSAQLKVGLEIHQQLSSATKLFCLCPPVKSDQLPYFFERRLRPSQSELGRVDPAAVFEYSKGKVNQYLWNPESSCLVEADEEPPHPVGDDSLEASLAVALMLNSNVVDEIHVMRKIVIDGSNTTGFQRTAIIGLGGGLSVADKVVKVQTVTLEEDAARIISEDSGERRFALDRLGVPLVEVALDPVTGTPEFIGRVALHLGRVLRSTGRVARGLGTIRQDLNISVANGKVVEVKGVQKLNLIPKVVEYELRRQLGLIRVAEKLEKSTKGPPDCKVSQATQIFSSSSSETIRREVASGGKVACISVKIPRGLLGWEPFPGVRLGRELAEVARANGLGGIIHSDEFAKQGISKEVEALLMELSGDVESSLVLVAGPVDKVDRTIPYLVERLTTAYSGVPAETRSATEKGETRYMRPRPGAQRMYPETDIPEIELKGDRLAEVKSSLRGDWTEEVESLKRKYSLSEDLALKVYDSEHAGEFMNLMREVDVEPSVAASILVDLPARLSREGIEESSLGLPVLKELIMAIAERRVAKEAAPDVLREVGRGANTVEGAIDRLGLRAADVKEVIRSIDAAISRNHDVVSGKGEAAFSPLMGEVMRELRGRADGALVSRLLKERLEQAAKRPSSD
ncbi:MAG: Glu-tRNA(Gln) amidotransferase subunit GatE [Thaumarchaeota archaeon]|nr:Glu-tRNA(Gln) amidotransferase subunit GatE [Nitrososphaerota archaeon]